MRRWLILAALLLVPVAGQAQTIEYYGLDAVGSVRVVFDANGNVLSRADYAPFGEPLFPATGKQQQVYAGLFAEGEAGFDYAEARMYQRRTGRFNTVDPVYNGLFHPEQWNRYTYVASVPTQFVDATGLQRNRDLCTPDITKVNPNDWHCISGFGLSPFALPNPQPGDNVGRTNAGAGQGNAGRFGRRGESADDGGDQGSEVRNDCREFVEEIVTTVEITSEAGAVQRDLGGRSVG